MKKIFKHLILITILICTIILLTGCGNRLIATKETEDNGMKVKIEYDMKFKKDIVDTIKMTSTYENEEDAETIYKSYEFINSFAENEEEKINVQKEENKIIITLTSKQFQELEEEEIGLTKDEIKKSLEKEGFQIK